MFLHRSAGNRISTGFDTYKLTFDQWRKLAVLPGIEPLHRSIRRSDDPRPSGILGYSKIHDDNRIDTKAASDATGKKMTPCLRADGTTSLHLGTWLAFVIGVA